MVGFTKLLTVGSLATLMIFAQAQAEVYRTVDADGNVIFTDVKPEDKKSETVDIGPVLTLPATPVKPRPHPRAKKRESSGYQSIIITSPDDQQSFQNPVSITVTAKVIPSPKNGHRFRLLVDGDIEQDSDSPTFKINQPNRGAHSLQVQVIDAKGKALISGKISTIYVHRHSVLFKKSSSPGDVTIQPVG